MHLLATTSGVIDGGAEAVDLAQSPADAVVLSAAALGEEHHGQHVATRHLEHPISLFVIYVTLCAGEHRVVVTHRKHARATFFGVVRIDRSGSTDETVCGRIGDEVFFAASLALSRNSKTAVFLERSIVQQIRNVLACRAATLLATLGNRLGSC